MPNQETSVDQYRNGTTTSTTTNRKASFIENLTPNTQSVSRKNSAHSATPPKPVKEEVLYHSKSLKLSEYTFSDCHGNQKSAEVIHKHFDPSNLVPQTYGTETTELTAKNTGLLQVGPSAVYDHPDQGILSIAILKRHILCDCLILVKKYRPTLKSFVLEFPAKIVEHNNGTGNNSAAASTDGNESDTSVGDAAVRDVEENTGYKSTQVKWVSPDTAVDPELCDNKLKLVSLIIDGDDPIKNDLLNQCSSAASDDEDSENKHECTNECLEDIEVIPVPINGLLDRLNEYSRRNVVVDSRVYAFAIGLKKGEKMAAQALKGEQVEMQVY